MTKKLLQLYGLKWNPFAPDVPIDAVHVTPRLESFVWRVEHLARDGGFAAIIGEPGTGKSILLRVLAARLGALRDVVVGVLTRPQAGLADFSSLINRLCPCRRVRASPSFPRQFSSSPFFYADIFLAKTENIVFILSSAVVFFIGSSMIAKHLKFCCKKIMRRIYKLRFDNLAYGCILFGR